jgi:ssDNA-binding Zn-finger/Zn-ribbon topoisomerase 1
MKDEPCPVCGCTEWYADYDRVEDGEMRVDRCERCGWPPPYPATVEEWRKRQGIS